MLLDTHALLWALADDGKLSETARAQVVDLQNQIVVSAASAIEIAIKKSLGKLQAPDNLADAIDDAGFIRQSIDFATAEELEKLPSHHRDPFDRMLIAQARVEQMPVVTRDPIFARYAIQTIW